MTGGAQGSARQATLIHQYLNLHLNGLTGGSEKGSRLHSLRSQEDATKASHSYSAEGPQRNGQQIAPGQPRFISLTQRAKGLSSGERVVVSRRPLSLNPGGRSRGRRLPSSVVKSSSILKQEMAPRASGCPSTIQPGRLILSLQPSTLHYKWVGCPPTLRASPIVSPKAHPHSE